MRTKGLYSHPSQLCLYLEKEKINAKPHESIMLRRRHVLVAHFHCFQHIGQVTGVDIKLSQHAADAQSLDVLPARWDLNLWAEVGEIVVVV